MNPFQQIRANAHKLSTDGVEQRKFVVDSVNLAQNEWKSLNMKTPVRKFLNTIARAKTTNLKMKNVTLAFRSMEARN